MQINIKIMSEEAYKTLQKNYKEVTQMIINHPSDCSWLNEYLGFEPFEEKKYVIDIEDLEDDEDYSVVTLSNTKKIYEAFKDLPRYVLCNNRFWAWFTFEKAYKQAIHASGKRFNEEYVKNQWLQGNSRRDLMLGIISKYYFYAEISVDKNLENQYELTEYAFTNAEAYRNLVYRNIGMLKNVSLEYLRVQCDYSKKTGKIITKPQARELMKEVSRMGSVMLIDLVSNKEIYDYLVPKLEKIVSL